MLFVRFRGYLFFVTLRYLPLLTFIDRKKMIWDALQKPRRVGHRDFAVDVIVKE